jgi:hypothetical protein
MQFERSSDKSSPISDETYEEASHSVPSAVSESIVEIDALAFADW